MWRCQIFDRARLMGWSLLLGVNVLMLDVYAQELVPNQPPIEVSIAGEAAYFYLQGERAARQRDYAAAAKYFAQALQRAPSIDVAERTAQAAYLAGDDTLAMVAITQWQALDAASVDASELKLRIVLRAEDVSSAPQSTQLSQALQDFVQHYPKGVEDGLYQAARILVGVRARQDESR